MPMGICEAALEKVLIDVHTGAFRFRYLSSLAFSTDEARREVRQS